jgi:hypothetical protein
MSKYPAEPLRTISLADFSWLTGSWDGEKHGEAIEEHWSAAAAGAMLGMFRWLRAERGVLYELMTLESEAAGGITLRIKHFGAGLVGWEEKENAVVFTLVARDSSDFVFRQQAAGEAVYLIYRLFEEGGMIVFFANETIEPDPETGFRYLRVVPS